MDRGVSEVLTDAAEVATSMSVGEDHSSLTAASEGEGCGIGGAGA